MDDRFKNLVSDPRFKVLKKKDRKVRIDDRFKSMFTDEKFAKDATNLKKFYDYEEEEEEEDPKDEQSLSESSDESESDDEEVDIQNIEFNWQPLDHDAETAEKTSNRLAIQNMDWDNIDVKDLFTLIKSYRMPLNVRIYKSEFGKERLAKEEVEGPQELIEMPKEDEVEEEYEDLKEKMRLIKNVGPKTYKLNEYEDADEQLDLKNEELRERVRKYQLNRMKYYYAIAEFDSVDSAELVYKELDGMDYEGSSVELDIRFVPDDVEFNTEDIIAECNEVPDLSDYKAPQFINSALQQTHVNFTWDQTDTKRQEKLHRAFTKEELEKDDLEAYLASDTDEDEDEEEENEANDKISVITGNSEARRNKYKKLLEDLEKEKEGKRKVDVDVEWGEDEEAESDSDDCEDHDEDEDEDEEEEEEEEEDEGEVDEVGEQDYEDEEDDEKDDEDEESEAGSEKEEDKKDDDIDFFDDVTDNKADFKFNPDDERFQAVYESSKFNIDPSHPKFKRTKAFDIIADRKRRKRLI